MKPFVIISAAMALLVGSACQPMPAQAGVATAAWAVAGTICRVLDAGESIASAVTIGIDDAGLLWARQMRHPAFERLLVAEVVNQCPGALVRAGQHPTASPAKGWEWH